MLQRKTIRRAQRAGGFTLAELIAAAAITTLAVIALVTVLRKGNEITTSGMHRERARAIIDSCFESPANHFSNYENLATTSRTVVIDPRDETISTDDLTGTLQIAVGLDTNTTLGTGVRDIVIYKPVTISVSWLEPEGLLTISIDKMITNIESP